ncbi:LRR receptor-like serine/threonine-protein kinase EFR [Cryptomeria japonica]|uniref:LRR receptor-like serine/threonine-protein kinase EFR n=1 Tax=Cryptomeria japonica TaxID=3369 RepID=UPI0027DA22A4|nr:LRR receptor-like serine/threonine-protein kinase EFR [Cryptomeria japonica]
MVVKLSPGEVAAAGRSSGSESDVASLMEFKNAITQDPLAVLHNWKHRLHFCNWTGIRCNTEKWRVVTLHLKNMSLQGVLPPQLGNLSFLHYLDLSFNRIGGPIPSALGRLSRLNFLYLHANLLEGSFTHSLGNLRNLQVLTSWANRHTGSISTALGNCSMLRVIDLSDNDLEGTIPSQIGSLTKLEVLHLDNNRISGEIPTSVLNCTELRNLSLFNNSLSGVIPSEMGIKISKLEYLILPKIISAGRFPNHWEIARGFLGLNWRGMN